MPHARPPPPPSIKKMKSWYRHCHSLFLFRRNKRWLLRPISLAETSPRLISRGNSGDSGDQKMACALTKATSGRRPRQGDNQFARPSLDANCHGIIFFALSFLIFAVKNSGKKFYGTTNSPGSLDNTSTRSVTWSLEVGQAASSSVGETSPQRLFSLLGLQQVSETSQRRLPSCGQNWSPKLMETSRRRLRDLLETGKVSQKSNMFEFPATPETRLVSRRRRGDVSATSGDSSRHQVATESPGQ